MGVGRPLLAPAIEPAGESARRADAERLASVALISGGRAHFLAGNIGGARDRLRRGLAREGAREPLSRIRTLGALALLDAWVGETTRATELTGQARAEAQVSGALTHPATADAHLADALVAVSRGDPSVAERELRAAALRATVDDRSQTAWIAYAIGRELGSVMDEEPTAPLPSGSPPPIVVEALVASRARRARRNGDPAAALAVLADRSPAASAVLFERGLACLALGRSADAREALRLHSGLPDSGEPLHRIRSLVLATSLSAMRGRTPRTDDLLVQALRIADEYGLVSVFLDAGPDTTSRILGLGLPSLPPVATQVIRCASTAARAADGAGLAEPLTDRERELLVLLPTGFTNTQLADRYFVSVNTIKSHMAHLYRKLEVSTRSGAIERATLLGLIRPWSDGGTSAEGGFGPGRRTG
ncbi:LuxR C-terminal-related transcriptional regulator [Leifsonia shinshuensis]|uniref:response regulator transcription factor n=1 Tax=Leifsonia shinshuensis TaxID=150026 RepID=UPI0028549D06|nr:LuxR C-terminal-related transcriptional regulator [Leifsonia shinshuensis]MDR6971964.1 DNA-binding CsgD family transcriptional regulator [Leifsonia shinshuensis]